MILLIDSYDSFTNNLSCLIEKSTGKKVVVIPNDAIQREAYEVFLQTYLDSIAYIVIGPGPGLPSIASDVGIISWLFSYFKANSKRSVPILGICLGFQCLCYEFGNEVKQLDNVKHGQIYDVESLDSNEPLYEGQYGKLLPSVRYHSLFVDMKKLNSEIIPLAVCHELPNNTQILMSGKHRELPFYGVQYHPESICTKGGEQLIKNFDAIAQLFNKSQRAYIFNSDDSSSSIQDLQSKIGAKALVLGEYEDHHQNLYVSVEKLEFGDSCVLPLDICDLIVKEEDDANFILLNSASTPGEWSIIGLPEKSKSEVITHSVDNPNEVIILKYKSSEKEQVVTLKESELAWNHVAKRFSEEYVSRENIISRTSVTHSRDFPFLGGYLGLFSYEEGKHVVLEKLGKFCNGPTPDLKLVFVERFLLYDHLTNKWFVFSVNHSQDDSQWCREFADNLRRLHDSNSLIGKQSLKLSMSDLLTGDDQVDFDFPSEDIYKTQFQKCQEFLHSGDSYELCLTVPLKISLPSHVKSWDVYRILLEKNPSPFSCFMDFDDVVLISSSPERFLSWKGEPLKGDLHKYVELRPIKGTVRKADEITLEDASKILKTPKEMGENLMIVDLIRHDLHQFIDEIEVPYLMSVEEYKTVYQLVSVVKGKLSNDKYHGIDILHSSLPPGSMTGAPKKRSIEILQDLEHLQPNAISGGRRGIYSGVVGYWSVTDDSDWSVIIRSVFHYKDDLENNSNTSLWRIGAGGAITVLSEPNDEWEEMRVKLTSALQIFQ